MFAHAGLRDASTMPLFETTIMGRLSVLIFFALSGYVLALPFFGVRPPTTGEFLVRRVCRIYLPYLAAMAVGFFILGGSFVPIVLMAGTPAGVQPDPPTWSLVVEMRYSLLFPLLVFAVARKPALSAIVAFATTVGFSAYASGAQLVKGVTVVDSLMVTAYFGSLFVGGILVARYRDRIEAFAQVHLLRLWAAAISLVGIGLFVDVSLFLAAILIVAIVPVSPLARRAALVPPLLWLGRVSYSLYLVHWIVQAALLKVVDGQPASILLYVSITFLFSEIGYRYVELPSIALGRLLTSRRAPTGA